MKTLYLFRHARAVRATIGVVDQERMLEDRGKNDALKMGQRLKSHQALPQLIISSPVTRAVESAQLLAQTIAYPIENIKLDQTIYDENPKKVIEMIRQFDDQYRSALIVGHNPVLEDVVHYFYKKFAENIPTAGVVALDFDVQSWQDLQKNHGKLQFFDFPNTEVKREFFEKKVREKLLLKVKIAPLFEKIDQTAANNCQDIFQKAAKKMVKKFVSALSYERLLEVAQSFQPGEKAVAHAVGSVAAMPEKKKRGRKKKVIPPPDPATPEVK
ncbi:histidine phosphatase family protein [candidate division KSB1 bacterium]|nr:histidine phosphatase family protein [candidate division KSB1 bacterium]